MILVDLSQIVFSNIMQSIKSDPDINEDLIRHMILNSIRSYNNKFKKEYGDLILCCDDFKYWRKDYFPYYKANRKKHRENSILDWKKIFESFNKIKEELKEHFPYTVVQASGAESDDIIATMIIDNSLEYINNNNKILIISGDHDFFQLHKFPNVDQYDPVQKKKVKHNHPDVYLKEHILRGDVGDGIPNYLSSDDCFIMGKRQSPISSKKLKDWLEQTPEVITNGSEGTLRNYFRNEKLIDLSKIPDEIKENIRNEYRIRNQNKNSRSKLVPYFVKNRLSELLEHINEF